MLKSKDVSFCSKFICICLLVTASTHILGSNKQRPVLFLNKQQLESIQVAIKHTHRRLWYDFKSNADAIANRKPPKYKSDIGEQLWQREVGSNIALLAFAGLVSEDIKYFNAASTWAIASCNYPSWGLDRNGKDVDYGLPYGHQLLGLAMLYDYGQPYLDKDVLEQIRKTLESRTSRQYKAYKDIKHGYMQNHTWINATGMLASALALGAECAESKDWITLASQIFKTSAYMLSPDGASQEGVGYWTYGGEFLLAAFYLSKACLGINYYDCPWFKNTYAFGTYLRIPKQSWREDNNIIDISDSKRFTWYGPEHIFRGLAAVNKDHFSQWYANEVGRGKTNISWYNILYYDPTIEPINPDTLPTLKHFTNMDIVSARSDWSGKESMLVFKCGAPLGKFANDAPIEIPDIKDLGHVHPDANHFVIFANGQYLIKNNGYVKRQTKYHNTLLIDEKGQWGENRTWFSPFPLRREKNPQIISVQSNQEADQIVGDASHAYFDESGLKKFVRKLIYVKPNVLLVIDDIEVDSVRNLSLLFYPEFPLKRESSHVLTGLTSRNNFRVEVLTSENCEMQYTTQEIAARHGNTKETTPLIKLKSNKTKWQSITAFSWSNPREEPVKVELERKGEQIKLIVANKTYLAF